MGAVRKEAEAAREAEAAALDVAKRAAKEVEAAQQKVKEAHRTESNATAKLQVKVDEAARLTSECSVLRSDNELLREKSDASGTVVKALTATVKKLKLDLAISEAKHDWSQLQEPLPDFSSEPREAELTLEDVELALTQSAQDLPAEVTSEVRRFHIGRRLRCKTRVENMGSTAEASTGPAAELEQSSAASGNSRRVRSRTPEPVTQKRARVSDATDAGLRTVAAGAKQVVFDPSQAVDAD